MKNKHIPKIQVTSLNEKIYTRLIQAILEGQFKPGERIVCNDLATRIGVSRTPLKEALIRLEEEGFVYSIPRRGTYINKFTSKDMQEIYDIREALEGIAACLAASSPNISIIKQMRKTCQNYKEGIQKKDIELCINKDLEFHQLLAKGSGNKRLIQILERFHIQTISIFKKGDNYWANASTYLQDHLVIVDSISRGQGEIAEKMVREHIRRGRGMIS